MQMRKKGQTCVRTVCRFALLASILLVLGTSFVPQAFAEKGEIRVIIPGVTDSMADGAIIADSFQWGVAPAPSTSGRSGGVSVHDFVIKKMVDAASPSFFLTSVSGAHYPKVTIEMRKAGGSSVEVFLQFTLTNVLVTSLSLGGSRGSGEPEEMMSLNFSKIDVQYQQQKPAELDCADYPNCVAQLPR
jgi:type VI secretion system secreted protein Hcp